MLMAAQKRFPLPSHKAMLMAAQKRGKLHFEASDNAV
jgi:hypothetical protein